MYIHTPSNTLILKTQDTGVITSVIPRSRVVFYKGVELVQVHFGHDEMTVLKNMGFKVPSPIRTNYEWRRNPTRVPQPFKHQINTSDFLTMNRRCICLNDMGTGKSLSALWSADYLMDLGVVIKCIIVTPRSTMHSVWENEILTHLMFNRRAVVLSGSKERRLKLLAEEADFYIINHDGLKVIHEELRQRSDINLWILDEAAQGWRNAQTDRYKLTKSLIRRSDWLWLMTGTPTPTAPTDAWALAKLIESPNAPRFFNAFKEQVMMPIGPYKWVPRIGATQKAYDILQPGIRYKKSECMDLPPVTYQYRTCALTSEQRKVFMTMQAKMVMEISAAQGQITAANAAVKLSKLLQITCGAVYDDYGTPHVIDASDRMELVEELVEETENKAIVFVPFKSALKNVADRLSKRWSVAVVSGDTSDGQRKQIFSDFQNAESPRILVAHPQTTAHGLTLTRADLTIWYAPVFSLEIFDQANNRMDRPGQTNKMTIAMIAATGLEMQIYKTLETRGHMQKEFLDRYIQAGGAPADLT